MLLKDYRFMVKIQGLEPIFKDNYLSSLIPSSSITLNFRAFSLVLLLHGDLVKMQIVSKGPEQGMKSGISHKLLGVAMCWPVDYTWDRTGLDDIMPRV